MLWVSLAVNVVLFLSLAGHVLRVRELEERIAVLTSELNRMFRKEAP